ncbi:MAG: cell division protein FtsQ/DivIB [Christensenellales bacterium]
MPEMQRVPEYYPPPEVPQDRSISARSQQTGQQEPEAPKERSPGSKMLILACTILIVVSAAFILRGFVFTIKNVRVIGISSVSWQEVALSAGLSPASHYFNLDEAQIRKGINGNRYLVFQGMEKVFPNTLVLRVKERRPLARINYIGIAYIMADDGIILEKTKDLGKYASLMTISGLAIRDIHLGAQPLSTRSFQVDACISVAGELQAQGFDSQITDVNVAEPASIYMTSNDSFSIHLGDSRDLRAKIGTARAVLQACRAAGYRRGVIEATVPGFATYRPDSVSREMWLRAS